MKRTLPLLFALIIATLLGGCDSSITPPAGPTTASALAVSLINTQTCDIQAPQTINDRVIVDDEQSTDVTTLSPACSP